MAEKRRHKRYAKRLTVRYGAREINHTGYVVDVSLSGMFIASGMLPELHSRLHLMVQSDSGGPVYFEGIVARHKQVPPELRSIARGGFGVRFLLPEELLAELVPKSLISTAKLDVTFRTREDLKAAFDREIRAGGLFLQSDKKFERDAVVTLVMRLAFADCDLEFEGKVVHVTGGETPGPKGVALVFVETRKAQEVIATYL